MRFCRERIAALHRTAGDALIGGFAMLAALLVAAPGAVADPAKAGPAAARLSRRIRAGSLRREGKRLTGVKALEGQETPMKKLTGALAAGFAASLPVAGTAWAQAGERYYYGHHDMMGGWFGGVLMMLLIIALIVGAVVLTLRLLGLPPGVTPAGRSTS